MAKKGKNLGGSGPVNDHFESEHGKTQGVLYGPLEQPVYGGGGSLGAYPVSGPRITDVKVHDPLKLDLRKQKSGVRK